MAWLLAEIDAEIDRRSLSGILLSPIEIRKGSEVYQNSVFFDIRTKCQDLLAAMAKVEGAITDLPKLATYTAEFRHESSSLSRSDHLRFCWYLTLDLAYNYREKVKNYLSALEDLVVSRSGSHTILVGDELKKIDKYISTLSRERGQRIHNGRGLPQEILNLELQDNSDLASQADHEVAAVYYEKNYANALEGLNKIQADAAAKVTTLTADLFGRTQMFFAEALDHLVREHKQLSSDGYVVAYPAFSAAAPTTLRTVANKL